MEQVPWLIEFFFERLPVALGWPVAAGLTWVLYKVIRLTLSQARAAVNGALQTASTLDGMSQTILPLLSYAARKTRSVEKTQSALVVSIEELRSEVRGLRDLIQKACEAPTND